MTTPETPAEVLAPCPFCGNTAQFHPYKRDGLELKCATPGCCSFKQRVLRKSIEWLRAAMTKKWNSRSLAAGKVADPVTEVMKHAQQALYWREKYEMLERDAKNRGLEPAPPADPAKASEPDDARLVAWSRTDSIRDANGYPIGTDATEVKWQADRPDGDGWMPLYDGPTFAKASEPEYDRSLIADMLESANGLRDEMYSHDAIIEQIRLLRAADNADASKVRTVRRASGSAPDGWRNVLKRAREGLGAGGALGVSGSRQRELEVEIGGMLLDHIEDGLEALTATPPASAPEVTEEMVERANSAYFADCHRTWKERIRAALTAALQQEGKSHD